MVFPGHELPNEPEYKHAEPEVEAGQKVYKCYICKRPITKRLTHQGVPYFVLNLDPDTFAWTFAGNRTEAAHTSEVFDERARYNLKSLTPKKISQDLTFAIGEATKSRTDAIRGGYSYGGNPYPDKEYDYTTQKEYQYIKHRIVPDVVMTYFNNKLHYLFTDDTLLVYPEIKRIIGDRSAALKEHLSFLLRRVATPAIFFGPGEDRDQHLTELAASFMGELDAVILLLGAYMAKVFGDIAMDLEGSRLRSAEAVTYKVYEPCCKECVENDRQALACSEIDCDESGPAKYFVEDSQDSAYRVLCKREHGFECSDCSRGFDREFAQNLDGSIMCEDCFSENAFMCVRCDATYALTDGKETRDGIMLCNNCAAECASCNYGVDRDDAIMTHNEKSICSHCFELYYAHCDECSDVYQSNDLEVVDNIEYCPTCLDDTFLECSECAERIRRSDAIELDDGNEYCEECAEESGEARQAGQLSEYTQYIEADGETIDSVTYTKQDRIINALRLLVPIKPAELAKSQPRLAQAAKDIIRFSKGREITAELLDEFRQKLGPETFPLQYGTWSGQQRSLDVQGIKKEDLGLKKRQLVIKIIANARVISALESTGTLALFNAINETSKRSGHPYSENMLGWVRVDVDPNGKYILVDEIQSDHLGAIAKIRQNDGGILDSMVDKTGQKREIILESLGNLKKAVKNFVDIAFGVISHFAKTNRFETIYYHNYETGKKLKRNNPAPSTYEDLPKKHFFELQEAEPFNLQGDFFVRKAHERIRILKSVLHNSAY